MTDRTLHTLIEAVELLLEQSERMVAELQTIRDQLHRIRASVSPKGK